jgi:hypothetical protein
VANLDLSEYVPGSRAFFSVSAIPGRTFEIFLEEHKENESRIDGVKDLFQGTGQPPTLLREDGRTIVSAKRLDCNSDKSPFEVVFDQTVYQLNPVNMSLLDRLATGIYIHIPLKLPPFRTAEERSGSWIDPPRKKVAHSKDHRGTSRVPPSRSPSLHSWACSL